MAKLNDLTSVALLQLLSAFNTAKGGLAINLGGAATVKTAAALQPVINGVQYTKAALAAQAINITHDAQGSAALGFVQPSGVTVYYTLGTNAAGAVSVSQGTFNGQRYSADPSVGLGSASAMGTSFIGNGAIPDVPAGFAPFGVIKVVTAGLATFTAGTTALDATNVTASFFDIALVPGGLL